MKNILLIIFLLWSTYSISKDKPYRITGTIQENNNTYYAYIYFNNTLLRTKVRDGKFMFSGMSSTAGKGYVGASIYLDTSGSLTVFEIKALRKNLSVYSNRITSYTVALEDLDLLIINPDKINEAKIMSGGELTKVINESYTYIKEDRVLEFYKAHPNSPVGVSLLNVMIRLHRFSGRRATIKEKFPVNDAYELLSDSLKRTAYVNKLKAELDRLTH